MWKDCIKFILGLFFSALTVYGIEVYAQDIKAGVPDIKLGIHYKKIPPKIRSNADVIQFQRQDPKKVQVIMFFSYSCYWCSKVNRPFDTWSMQLPEDVAAYHIPLFLYDKDIFPKAYYTVVALDEFAALDDRIFDALHKERKPIFKETELFQFIEAEGFNQKKFENIYHSFDIDRKAKRADEIGNAFQIPQTPVFVVNGPKNSYITNLTMTYGVDKLFEVLDFLVNKERQYLTED